MSDVIPGGREQGKHVSEASDSALEYWAVKGRESATRQACAAELARRGVAPPETDAPRDDSPPPQARQPRSIAKPAETKLVEGSFTDPQRATAALQQAAQAYHLVSPATVCGSLPEGCEVALSMVFIDPNDKNLYPLAQGKMGLDRVALMNIANAAGATVVESVRLDDRSHPHYCAWRVTIEYRLFDGARVQRSGSVEIDVREPQGAAYVEIVEKAKNAKDRGGNPTPRDPSAQLLELRKFIDRHAESKAMNRAVAAMGIRRSYTKEELQKPFAVARIIFTGKSSDPKAQELFRNKIADNFLDSAPRLYGQPARQLSAPQGYAPPPQQSRPVVETEPDGEY